MGYSWDIANEIIADNENETDNPTYGLRRGVKPELIRDLCFAVKVDPVMIWGISDRHTWIRHPDWMPGKTFRDNPNLWKFLRPLPFDENLQAKPARNAIAQAFQ